MQTVFINRFRYLIIPRSNILTTQERKGAALDVRWARLCSFVLLSPFQRLGHRCRCFCRQRFSLMDIASAARMFKFWHYLLRDSCCVTTSLCNDLLFAMANDGREFPIRFAIHQICDHISCIHWHMLPSYLSFSVCSKSCLRLIVRYARDILFGYDGTHLTERIAHRFILITSARYNRFEKCAPGTSRTGSLACSLESIC